MFEKMQLLSCGPDFSYAFVSLLLFNLHFWGKRKLLCLNGFFALVFVFPNNIKRNSNHLYQSQISHGWQKLTTWNLHLGILAKRLDKFDDWYDKA